VEGRFKARKGPTTNLTAAKTTGFGHSEKKKKTDNFGNRNEDRMLKRIPKKNWTPKGGGKLE